MKSLLEFFRPSACCETVAQIDISALKKLGIDTALIDLDNTLAPWRSQEIFPEIASWVVKARQAGFKFCIVSNTRNSQRLRKLAGEFDIPFVKQGLKPLRRGFVEALELLGSEKDSCVVIGDQIFTDILGGNRLGVHTILVCPLRKKEFFGTKISRQFEKIILRLLERKGMMCQSGDSSQIFGEQMTRSDSHMKSGQ